MFLGATYITATDADVGNANNDIVGIFEGWDRSILKTGVARTIEDTREILTGHEIWGISVAVGLIVYSLFGSS